MMPVDIDMSFVATLVLLVLVLAYGAIFGALVMWIGRTDDRVQPAAGPAEPASLREAA